MSDLRYPIGAFSLEGEITAAQRQGWDRGDRKDTCRPSAAVAGLTPDQVNTPYRPEGWTARQVVHHVPDSHLNAYTRLKLALTEDEPTIKPYDEVRWAELNDTRTVSLEVSLTLLEMLHERWVALLRSLTPEEYRRTFRHPESGRVFTLEETLAEYAWHGRHHVAHITTLRQRQGW